MPVINHIASKAYTLKMWLFQSVTPSMFLLEQFINKSYIHFISKGKLAIFLCFPLPRSLGDKEDEGWKREAICSVLYARSMWFKCFFWNSFERVHVARMGGQVCTCYSICMKARVQTRLLVLVFHFVQESLLFVTVHSRLARQHVLLSHRLSLSSHCRSTGVLESASELHRFTQSQIRSRLGSNHSICSDTTSAPSKRLAHLTCSSLTSHSE